MEIREHSPYTVCEGYVPGMTITDPQEGGTVLLYTGELASVKGGQRLMAPEHSSVQE